jgi:hypothetical protein
VTTVKATIGTSLDVTAHGSQNYGLLFGQEQRSGGMAVQINEKAKADANLDGVTYDVGCNDTSDGGNSSSICPFLTLTDSAGGKLVIGETQATNIAWLFVAPDCEQSAQKKDAPRTVPCNQDKNWDLSGAVFINVTGYQGDIKELLCDKKTGEFVNPFTGVATGISCTV